MANGILASSRGALIFAGGVIACALIAAVSLGSNFTPKPADEAVETSGAGSQANSEIDDSETQSSEAPQVSQASENVFGDFEGFADDGELIDDTAGFDPTPDDSAIVLAEPDRSGFADNDFGDDNGGFADAGTGTSSSSQASRSSNGARTSSRSSRPRPPSQTRRTAARPKGISVEEMKKRLAQSPIVGDGGE